MTKPTAAVAAQQSAERPHTSPSGVATPKVRKVRILKDASVRTLTMSVSAEFRALMRGILSGGILPTVLTDNAAPTAPERPNVPADDADVSAWRDYGHALASWHEADNAYNAALAAYANSDSPAATLAAFVAECDETESVATERAILAREKRNSEKAEKAA